MDTPISHRQRRRHPMVALHSIPKQVTVIRIVSERIAELLQAGLHSRSLLPSATIKSTFEGVSVMVSRRRYRELCTLMSAILDEPSLKPRKFLVDVEETMRLVLEQEDTDNKAQIHITDSGPKVFALGTVGSNGYRTVDVSRATSVAIQAHLRLIRQAGNLSFMRQLYPQSLPHNHGSSSTLFLTSFPAGPRHIHALKSPARTSPGQRLRSETHCPRRVQTKREPGGSSISHDVSVQQLQKGSLLMRPHTTDETCFGTALRAASTETASKPSAPTQRTEARTSPHASMFP